MSGQIFISYRREESRWSARILHDRLRRDFDANQIFIDIDAIPLGEDFVEVIETTVAKCDVLIAVIGNNWLTSKDAHGNRRLDKPEDFVRMEIGTALKRKIRVIPVLVDGASMPESTDLPEDLKPLVRRNALLITDTSFESNCEQLAATIRQVLEKPAAKEQERLATEQRQREKAEARERAEKERLEAKERERRRLEAEERRICGDKNISILSRQNESVKERAHPRGFVDAEQLNELAIGRFPKEVTAAPDVASPYPVDCTVFAPGCVERNREALLQVFLRAPKNRERAEVDALKFDPGTKERGYRSLLLDAPIGTEFIFDVEVRGFVFSQRFDSLLWTGEPQSIAFPFVVPAGCNWGQHVGVVRVWKDQTFPIGKISFQIDVVGSAQNAHQKPVGDDARRYRSCFCSYSSLDRAEMLKRAQGIIQAIGVDMFIDVLQLRPGDKWDPKIFAAIDKCDLFVVIWSTNALNSKWVKKESRYALERYKKHGSPDFRPIPVEGPPIPPVPRGLRAYHFNDELLLSMRRAELAQGLTGP